MIKGASAGSRFCNQATGLLYVDPDAADLHAVLGTSKRPLNTLGAADLCPGPGALAKLNASLR